MLLRACALAVAKRLAVGLPAALVQLRIDQLARGRFIQFDRPCRRACRLPQLGRYRRWLLGRAGLKHPELGGQRRLVGFGFLGQPLPFLLVLRRLQQLGFGGIELGGKGALLALERHKLVLQAGQLCPQRLGFIRWCLRWPERPAAESRIRDRAVKPHPQLPGHLEGTERGGMVTVKGVGGVVAAFAQVVKQASHLTIDQAIALQPPHQRQLAFFQRREHAETGGKLLRKPFAQLAQFDQCRVRIIGEIALRQRPQPHQLGVVDLQMNEVGAHNNASSRWIVPAMARPCSIRRPAGFEQQANHSPNHPQSEPPNGPAIRSAVEGGMNPQQIIRRLSLFHTNPVFR